MDGGGCGSRRKRNAFSSLLKRQRRASAGEAAVNSGKAEGENSNRLRWTSAGAFEIRLNKPAKGGWIERNWGSIKCVDDLSFFKPVGLRTRH